MEDIHPDLVHTAAGNKMIGMICMAIAIIIVLIAISISVMFAFNLLPALSEEAKLSITSYAHTGLIAAAVLAAGGWLMLIKSISWFRQSTKIFNESTPVVMHALLKVEIARENKDVLVELTNGENKINICMYYPKWDISELTECEVEVYKTDEPGPIILKTPSGLLWPYPGIVKH